MDPMLGLFLKFLLVTSLFGALFVAHRYFRVQPGNTVEKIAEEVVEKETGVDVVSLEQEAEKEEDSDSPSSGK